MTVLFDPQQDSLDHAAIGGKGRNLYRLQQHHTVPEWVAIPVDSFFDFLARDGLGRTIANLLEGLTSEALASTAARIQALIVAAPLPDALSDRLATVVAERFGSDPVSVRSSAGDEDGATHSFAGIHESFLYVQGAASVADHVRKVWASGYQPRALAYRQENGLPLHPVPMAVIIQRMVDAASSGVVFTADPTTQDPHTMVISALFGLGEGLVSAGLDADHITYNKRTETFTTTLATKPTCYVRDREAGAGLRECPVDAALHNQPALTEPQLQQLVAAATAIENSYRRPQDIEFCFDAGGRLYILQTRDITTVDECGPAAGNREVWDNSNIIESYSGVTSPMTFSFIRHAYAVVYHCFSEVMGIPRQTIEQNEGVYRNMLGLFQGQVYYNLNNWYRLVQQFPGYAYNKTFMESMMGVKEASTEATAAPPPASAWRRYGIELPKLLRLAARMLHQFMTLPRLVPAFNRHFDHHYDAWAAMDFTALPPHALMQIYQDMEKHLLRNWKTPIINDFSVMVFYGMLKGCCKSWCGDTNGTLQNNLICGEGNIESTVPTRMLMQLAAEIKSHPEQARLFLELSPMELLEQIPKRPDTRDIKNAVSRYLDAYGFRCMNELKLEEPSLHETPEFVYQMIANYVRMDDTLLDIGAMEARERQIRAEAEQQAFARLSPPRKMVFRAILKHARNGVKNRENMRFARTKIYGMLRLLLNATGATLTEEGLLNAPADIYYLTLDEVWDYVRGTAVTTHLRELVNLRRTEFESYRNAEQPPADHFETYGMAYHRNRFQAATSQGEAEADDGTLRGIGCSPGVIDGVARVIHSPRDDIRLNGEILVAARTDPGWVPLYPSVSGILIERGSILSHSAIVAREMGIPAIVGIPNLLQRIADGQSIHMDAAAGMVTLKE